MKQLVFVSLVSALTLNSCADKDVYQGEQKNKPISPTKVKDFGRADRFILLLPLIYIFVCAAI